jgi:hypothetical protein
LSVLAHVARTYQIIYVADKYLQGDKYTEDGWTARGVRKGPTTAFNGRNDEKSGDILRREMGAAEELILGRLIIKKPA